MSTTAKLEKNAWKAYFDDVGIDIVGDDGASHVIRFRDALPLSAR